MYLIESSRDSESELPVSELEIGKSNLGICE